MLLNLTVWNRVIFALSLKKSLATNNYEDEKNRKIFGTIYIFQPLATVAGLFGAYCSIAVLCSKVYDSVVETDYRIWNDGRKYNPAVGAGTDRYFDGNQPACGGFHWWLHHFCK